MKKTDLMKAIERYDDGIAARQREIDAMVIAKTILEAVARENAAKKKPAKDVAQRLG